MPDASARPAPLSRATGTGRTGAAAGAGARLQFGTKAGTLERLAASLTRSEIPPLRRFEVGAWRADADAIVAAIGASFGDTSVAVRSSSLVEDGAQASLAGAFDSVLGVDANDTRALRAAIERVVASMAGAAGDEVLVQRMVREVALAGVVMTRELNTGAPYYVINYDDETGRTDTVTGGEVTNKTVYVLRGAGESRVRSPRIASILAAVREVETLFGGGPIDVEFALDRQGGVALLQVRPMTARVAPAAWTAAEIDAGVSEARDLVAARIQGHDRALLGRRSLLGLMPDWNPAELIGLTPRPLAMSTFRHVITRSSWRLARVPMGYRHLLDRDLMVDVVGHPYIDVRASFNSLLPADLDDALAARLVDGWIDRLAANPELHDKVEFAVAQTCLDFCTDDALREAGGTALDAGAKARFRDSLRALTGRALDLSPRGTLATATARLEQLEARQLARGIAGHAARPASEALRTAAALLDEARDDAAIAFATCARHAFIAESLLRSAVRRGAIDEARTLAFRRSLHTVASDFNAALETIGDTPDGARTFLARFGHLRPGTFDLTSPRYADRWEQLAGTGPGVHAPAPAFALTPGESTAIAALLAESRLPCEGPDALLAYCRRAIVAREHGKFVLSRSVSDALEMLAAWGRGCGLDRAEVAMIGLDALLAGLGDPGTPADPGSLRESIARARHAHAIAVAVRLPSLIVDPDDVYVAPVARCLPNLYGSGIVRGPTRAVGPSDDWTMHLVGTIVCIESADPGFDWIFGAGVAGLVTKFGGANSHMAIRCMELGVPAAIGCGEQLYARIVDAGGVEMNFEERTVRPRHAS